MKTKCLIFMLSLVFFGEMISGKAQTFTFLGQDAGLNNGTALYNSGFGWNALKENTTIYNSAFGANALANTGIYPAQFNPAHPLEHEGSYNAAFGGGALVANTVGRYNCAFGQQSMTANVTGYGNVAVGRRCLESNVNGNSNVAIGYGALLSADSNNNIAIGANSPRNFTIGGDRNIFIGDETAVNLNSGYANTIIGGFIHFDAAPSTPLLAGNNSNNTIILADGIGHQRLFIHSNGNTGIGLGDNNIPQNRLELNGGVAGTSGLRFRSYTNAIVPSASENKFLTVNNLGDVVLRNQQPVSIYGSSTTTVTGSGTPSSPYTIDACNLYACDGTISAGGLRTVTMDKNNLYFHTLPLKEYPEWGKVYIGQKEAFVHDTGDYRLYVEGGVLTEKVKVALRYNPDGSQHANWADYVFAKNYNLMPLEEVECFVKENNHLPGIESEAELVKNGLDLGDMQAKQMSKIEELTLYVIEQNKALDKQNKVLDKQSKELEELKAQVKELLEKTK
jgi:uncharacterized coiled-coil protein SlyX